MKILQVHNAYRHVGGEEIAVAAEKAMLEQHGHDVKQWIVENSKLDQLNTLTKISVALGSIWSSQSYRMTRKLLRDLQPDVVHVHNTTPQVSPSVYAACQSLKVPVVHTLHNYKLVCPGAYLYRDSAICEDCVGKSIPLPAIQHGCYRQNHFQTAVATTGLVFNRFKGTYNTEVDLYIALTRFARQKFINGGLPADKIAVKPNFVTTDIQPGNHKGGYALFVGKLVQYKGLETVLKAWDSLQANIPLKVIGQGPLEILLKSNIPKNIEYLGRLPRPQVVELLRNANLLIFPSEWYEGFPMVIAEAFATGCPVIAAKCGAAAEVVRDGVSGWHFNSGDSDDLVQKIECAWSNPEELRRRGSLAREQYDNHYSLERNYSMLMSLYETAIDWSKTNRVQTVF